MAEKKISVGDKVALKFPVLGCLPGTEFEISEILNKGKPVAPKGLLFRVKNEERGKEFLQWETMLDFL